MANILIDKGECLSDYNVPKIIIKASLKLAGVTVSKFKGYWIGHKYIVAIADNKYFKLNLKAELLSCRNLKSKEIL